MSIKKGTMPPRYDEAFKTGAVKMVTEQGRPSKEVAAEIKNALGVEIDRKKMSVADIKNFGEYTAEIKLYKGISAKITVKVTE